MGKKGKDAKRREKKQRTGKKHLSLKPNEYYDVSGGSLTRKRKSCPRCGQGTWLGEHKGRLYCGKCGYTEFDRKPAGQSPEKPTQESKPNEQPVVGQPQEKPSPETKPEEKQEQPPRADKPESNSSEEKKEPQKQ